MSPADPGIAGAVRGRLVQGLYIEALKRRSYAVFLNLKREI